MEFIPFAKPSISRQEEEAVLAVLRSGWLTTGQETREFEKEFAAYTGARYALAVSSATAGLHLSLDAIKKDNSTIITTPYTFTATAEVARYMGIDISFVDIEEESYNISPDLTEKYIKTSNRNISAIIPVHIGGLPCKMDALTTLSEKYNIPVIEDAAHAFPVQYNGRFAGTLGRAGVYSFYANKTITTGEGGMIVTDDEKMAKRMSIMRLHGIDRESWDRYTHATASWYYEVVDAGFKYNLTDIASAIGRVQLLKAESFRKKREEIARHYFRKLSSLDFLKMPVSSDSHAWHLFIIRLIPEKLRISRDEFIMKLKEKGIGTSVHYIPLHIMPYYRKKYALKPDDFPVSLKNYSQSLSLPIYPDLSLEQIEYIIHWVATIGKENYSQ